MTIKKYYTHLTTQIAISVACLYGLFLLLYIETINWPFSVIDTPLILSQAMLYSPLEYFTEPLKYQLVTYNNLTPWGTLSWDLDYTLFPLEPMYYRLHHLLSAGVLLGVVYLVLYRLTRSILNTSLFCFAVITLPATFVVFDDVVSRHYLEGMIFSLLSFYFAHWYSTREKLIGLISSVLLYILSITAKEVFIPLPGILFFVFQGGVRRKIILILPYALALLAYAVWRFHMLGDLGGYSSTTTLLDQIKSSGALILIYALLNLIRSLFPTSGAAALMLSLFSLLLFINFKRLSISFRIGLLVGVAGLMLPILALLPFFAAGPQPGRWCFAVSITFLLCFAYLCSITTSRVLTGVVFIVVFACSVQASVVRIHNLQPFGVNGEILYTQILKSDPDSYQIIPKVPLLVKQSLANWVYTAKLHNGVWGTLTVSDAGQLHYHDIAGKAAIVALGNALPMAEVSSTGQDIELSIIADYNSESDVLDFNFTDEINSDACFVYIFGEHNGLLFSSMDCRHWAINYRRLVYKTRGTGYKLSDMSIAVWTKHPEQRLYSKPVKLREIIDLDAM